MYVYYKSEKKNKNIKYYTILALVIRLTRYVHKKAWEPHEPSICLGSLVVWASPTMVYRRRTKSCLFVMKIHSIWKTYLGRASNASTAFVIGTLFFLGQSLSKFTIRHTETRLLFQRLCIVESRKNVCGRLSIWVVIDWFVAGKRHDTVKFGARRVGPVSSVLALRPPRCRWTDAKRQRSASSSADRPDYVKRTIANQL